MSLISVETGTMTRLIRLAASIARGSDREEVSGGRKVRSSWREERAVRPVLVGTVRLVRRAGEKAVMAGSVRARRGVFIALVISWDGGAGEAFRRKARTWRVGRPDAHHVVVPMKTNTFFMMKTQNPFCLER